MNALAKLLDRTDLRQRLSGDALKARAIRGTVLTGIGFFSENAIRLAGNLVLTRLLFPEAFGMMALIQVVMTGLVMFSEIGIRASIIQDDRGEDPDFLDTAWTIQIGRGVVLWLATCALAAPVASFYGEPLLASILPVAGLTALIQGMNSTRIATAGRHIALGRVTVMNTVAQIVGLIIMIALALWLRSVWALVVGGLIGPLIVAVLSHVALPGHRNRIAVEQDALKRLVRFGRYIFLSTIAGFLISQADRAVLGKIVPLGDLALYNIAYFLASVPLLMMRRLTDAILFPLYRTRPPGDSAENWHKIAKARFILTGTMMAAVAVLALIGNQLVIVLYDDRYEAAGPLLILIALGLIPLLIEASYGAMALARGDSGRFAAIVVGAAVSRTFVLLVAATQFGLLGVTLAPAISTLLFYPVLVLLIRRYGGWDLRHDLGFFLLGAGIAAAALWLNAEAFVGLADRFGP